MDIEKQPVNLAVIGKDRSFISSVCNGFSLAGFTAIGKTSQDFIQNPDEVGRFFDEFDPEVVLVDVDDPIAENWQTFEEIRRKIPNPETPFILVSNQADEVTRWAIPLSYPVYNKDLGFLIEWEDLVREQLNKPKP